MECHCEEVGDPTRQSLAKLFYFLTENTLAPADSVSIVSLTRKDLGSS